MYLMPIKGPPRPSGTPPWQGERIKKEGHPLAGGENKEGRASLGRGRVGVSVRVRVRVGEGEKGRRKGVPDRATRSSD